MTQEKNPTEFVRFLQFGTNLVSLIVEEVLPMMVVPQSASNALPELGLVDELNFLVLNPQSWIIAQVSLWSS